MRKRTGSSSPANRLRSNSSSRHGMACNRLMSMRTWRHALVQMALYAHHANTWSLTLCDPPPECPILEISHRGFCCWGLEACEITLPRVRLPVRDSHVTYHLKHVILPGSMCERYLSRAQVSHTSIACLGLAKYLLCS